MTQVLVGNSLSDRAPVLFSFGAIGGAAARLQNTGHVVVIAENHAGTGLSKDTAELPPALPDECAEAAGLQDPLGYLLRRRIARAVMAAALARRGGPTANDLRIAISPRGAPILATADIGLHLSFASRNGVNLIGIAHQRIGVDLEPAAGTTAIPWNILRSDEVAEIMALPEVLRLPRFLTLWIAKEAILKALGTGLTTSPEALKINSNGLVEHRPHRSSDDTWSAAPVELSGHITHDVFHNIFYIAVALLSKVDIAPFGPDQF